MPLRRGAKRLSSAHSAHSAPYRATRFTMSAFSRRMTYAIDTTKRKFNRLLDSLTNTSSTSLTSARRNSNASTTTLPVTFESPPKKPRMARPVSAFVRKPARSEPQSLMSSPIPRQKAAPGKEREDEQAPNFAPLDRAQFLARLRTFRHVDRWATKPAQINEVQWAKRGWSCVGIERVGCVGGCDKELVIKLERGEEDSGVYTGIEDEDDWNATVTEQLANRYIDLIVTGHDEYCLWRKRGCDATIYRLPLSPPATALSALRERYDSLAVMGDELPSALSIPAGVDMSIIIQELGADFFQTTQAEPAGTAVESAPSPAINQQALALAFFGWQAEDGHISGLAVCEACFRRLGLWLFKRKSQSTVGSETAVDDEEAAMSRLDVIGEHRDYCPWLDASSQNGDSTPQKGSSGSADLAGWEILARVVRNTARLNGRIPQSSATPKSGTIAVDGPVNDDTVLADKAGPTDLQALRDSKDKERWTKLRKLRQVFHIKENKKLAKGKGIDSVQRPGTAR